MASFTSFTITQPFLGAPLQFQPPLGSSELESLIDAFVTGSASKSDKLSDVTIDFYNRATVDLNTGALVRRYDVYSSASAASWDQSPVQSQSSGFSPPTFTPSPGSSSMLTDSGYGSFSHTPPMRHRESNSRVTKRTAAKLTKKVDEVRLPGFSIMTKDGVDVTTSAGRGTKTKEQREHAHLMRIMKACEACKRKKVKCDPAHRRSPVSASTSKAASRRTSPAARQTSNPIPAAPSISPQSSFESDAPLADFDTTAAFDFAFEDFVLFPQEASQSSADLAIPDFDSQLMLDFDFDSFLGMEDVSSVPGQHVPSLYDSSFSQASSAGLNSFALDAFDLPVEEYYVPQGQQSVSHVRTQASTSRSGHIGTLDASSGSDLIRTQAFPHGWNSIGLQWPEASLDDNSSTSHMASGLVDDDLRDSNERHPGTSQGSLTSSSAASASASPLESSANWSFSSASTSSQASPAPHLAATSADLYRRSTIAGTAGSHAEGVLDLFDGPRVSQVLTESFQGTGRGAQSAAGVHEPDGPPDKPSVTTSDATSTVIDAARNVSRGLGGLASATSTISRSLSSLAAATSSASLDLTRLAEACTAVTNILQQNAAISVEHPSLSTDIQRLRFTLKTLDEQLLVGSSDFGFSDQQGSLVQTVASNLENLANPGGLYLAERHDDLQVRSTVRLSQVYIRRLVRSLCATITSLVRGRRGSPDHERAPDSRHNGAASLPGSHAHGPQDVVQIFMNERQGQSRLAQTRSVDRRFSSNNSGGIFTPADGDSPLFGLISRERHREMVFGMSTPSDVHHISTNNQAPLDTSVRSNHDRGESISVTERHNRQAIAPREISTMAVQAQGGAADTTMPLLTSAVTTTATIMATTSLLAVEYNAINTDLSSSASDAVSQASAQTDASEIVPTSPISTQGGRLRSLITMVALAALSLCLVSLATSSAGHNAARQNLLYAMVICTTLFVTSPPVSFRQPSLSGSLSSLLSSFLFGKDFRYTRHTQETPKSSLRGLSSMRSISRWANASSRLRLGA